MRVLKKEISICYEIKKSKFLTYLVHYEDFYKTIEKLRKEHPKAIHYVWAYRYLKDGQIVENQSDDGEPKNTAGKPALNVLTSQNLINCAVIIVRYFGGIKLGASGLVKAYTKAVTEAVLSAEFEKYIEYENLKVSTRYENFSKLEYLLKNFEARIVKKDFTEKDVILDIAIEKNKKESLFERIKELITAFL
ncbi:YigZ family protein [Nitrosophilus labii]|uniref:YigZ family protein n=1 Tax=Nitrosophilus labii TaxID=2706014 RepID=UPI001657583A|nr:YigZ family protein [Nitrosophilus labii]